MSRARIRTCLPLGVIVCLLALTGCESRPLTPPGVTVVDSAGVLVVELGSELDGVFEQHALAGEPDWVIRFSEDDPASVVSTVGDVELLSQGRVAVADEGDNRILVFDSAGRHVSTWGGGGDGPGEFRRLDWLASMTPDTVAAGDARLRRVTMFDADGRLLGSFGTVAASTGLSTSVPPRPIGLLRDGSVVAAFFDGPAAVPGVVRPGVEIVTTPIDSDSVRILGTWPGDELSVFRQDGFLQVVAAPFGRRLHVAVGPDGVWVADDARWEVREYSGRGRLRTVVRSSASPLAVSDSLLEQRITEKYQHTTEDAGLQRLKRDQRRIAHHSSTPAFEAVLPMVGGGVAIGEYKVGPAPFRAWVTVNRRGGVTAVELPAGLEVKRWGPDWVIGVVRDELDREEIRRYAIVAAAAERRE